MIFAHTIIPSVLAGKTTTIALPLTHKRLPRKGHSYAIRSRTPAVKDEDGRIIKKTKLTTITRVIVHSVKKSVERQAWIVTFELDPSAPPFLMHQQSERGYTTQRRDALDPDADAVDPEILEDYAKDNWQRHLARKAADHEPRTLAERVAELEAAPHNEIGRQQLASLRQRIEQLERRRHRRAA